MPQDRFLFAFRCTVSASILAQFLNVISEKDDTEVVKQLDIWKEFNEKDEDA